MSVKPFAAPKPFLTQLEYTEKFPSRYLYFIIENDAVVKDLAELNAQKDKFVQEVTENFTKSFGVEKTIPMVDGTFVYGLTDEEKAKPDFQKKWEVVQVSFPATGSDELFDYYIPHRKTKEGYELDAAMKEFSVQTAREDNAFEMKKGDILQFDYAVRMESPSRPTGFYVYLEPEILLGSGKAVLKIKNPDRYSYTYDSNFIIYLPNPVAEASVSKYNIGFALSTRHLHLKRITEEEFFVLRDELVAKANDKNLDDVLLQDIPVDEPSETAPRKRPRGPKPGPK